jgi:hypothetical protein
MSPQSRDAIAWCWLELIDEQTNAVDEQWKEARGPS